MTPIDHLLLKSKVFSVALLAALLIGCGTQETVWKTDYARYEIDSKGFLTLISILGVDQNLLRRTSPLLTLMRDGESFFPVSAYRTGGSLYLKFEGDVEASIRIQTRTRYVKFELTALTQADSYDVAVWGPIATTLDEVIGETVGVVREGDVAVGIQSLNPKTLGGFPWNDNDTMPVERVFTTEPTSVGDSLLVYRIEAARPDSVGSSLQAYTRNRSRPRLIRNRGYDPMVASPFDDGGIVGTSIALFAVPRSLALDTIGQIELKEGLPHPMLDGEWVKTSRSARSSYIIMRYGEHTIEKALDVARRTGLRYIYHEAPFLSWGTFILNPGDFPRGRESLRDLVERAGEEGVMLGLHTLANFITLNDPLVSPVPDPRLSAIGSASLAQRVSDIRSEIFIEDPIFFNQQRRSHLGAARIGEELITYSGVSLTAPWELLNVRRGAYGTRVSTHQKGTLIHKLDDHVYRVFLGNAELSIQMARTLGELYRLTGVRQIGFDGHDGTRSSGLGVYGEILFAKAWYDAAGKDIQNNNITSGSRTSHYYWHIYTRMNWGEPWNHSFRVSQLARRLRSQDYYRRNYMPPMLGWFELRPESSVEDVEWMLALAAGFDAGFSFVTSVDTVRAHGRANELFERIRVWEKARMAKAFPDSLRDDLTNVDNEFVLAESGEMRWTLSPMVRIDFEGLRGEFRVPEDAAFSSITIQADSSGGPVHRVALGSLELNLDVVLGPEEILRIEPGKVALRFSRSWFVLSEHPVDWDAFNARAESLTFEIETNSRTSFSTVVRLKRDGILLRSGLD